MTAHEIFKFLIVLAQIHDLAHGDVEWHYFAVCQTSAVDNPNLLEASLLPHWNPVYLIVLCHHQTLIQIFIQVIYEHQEKD